MNLKNTIINNIRRYMDGEYHIGIVENWNINQPNEFNSKIHWIDMNGYSGGWLADPFIINVSDDTFTILVEEFRYDTRMGRLSEAIVSRVLGGISS